MRGLAAVRRPVSARPLRRAGSTAAVCLLGAACATVVSGCGSSSASSGGTTSTTAAATASGATGATGAAGSGFAAYQSCLKSHGVTFPAGGFGGRGFGGHGFGRGGAAGATGATGATGASGATGGSGTSSPAGPRGGRPALTPAEQKATKACASLLPSGGFAGRGPGAGGASGFANNPADKKFVACLKQHGVKTGGSGSGGSGSSSRGGFPGGGSSAERSAFAACHSLLPQGGFGGGRYGGGAAGSGGGGATGAAGSATYQRLEACLRQHGVQPGSAGSQNASKTQAAIAACQKSLSSSSSSSTTTSGTG